MKKKKKFDSNKVLVNREKMLLLAQQDWEKSIISKNQFRLLATFFHPDFKNIWDYKPMDTYKLRMEQETLDSNFWEFYKITPDFCLPTNMIYGLYKEFIFNNVNNFSMIKEHYNIDNI